MTIHMFSAGVNGVSSVSTNSERTVLQWDQMPNTDYPDCITSYSIGWNGMTYNTIDTATSVTRELLSASGFPFCMSTSVTVTPVTPMGLLDGRDNTSNISLISPGRDNLFCNPSFHRFPNPTISGMYTLKYINVSTIVDMNGANVTENSTIGTIVFSGMVQVRLSHSYYAQ